MTDVHFDLGDTVDAVLVFMVSELHLAAAAWH